MPRPPACRPSPVTGSVPSPCEWAQTTESSASPACRAAPRFCKPGFPGVIVVEGEESDVAEYVRLIKSLRWQVNPPLPVIPEADLVAAHASDGAVVQRVQERPG